MAQRRMFSKTVTDSARFLRMPMEARLLYYDLGMAADDDGCTEGFTVLMKTGGREKHLRLLEEKGFLKILNEDLVVYLLDWNENNRIRKDRYHQSAYWSLVEQILGPQEPQPEDRENREEAAAGPDDSTPSTSPRTNDSRAVTKCQPDDSFFPTEDRLGKDRSGKSSPGQDSIGQTRPGETRPFDGGWERGAERVHYGPYRNVELSLDEILDLTNKISGFDDKLKQFSAYLYQNGNHVDSCYRAMLDWASTAGRGVVPST